MEAAGRGPGAGIAGLDHDRDWLALTWEDGQQGRFPAVWLRDNLPGGRQGGPEGQRLFDVASLPPEVAISEVGLDRGGDVRLLFWPEGIAAAFPSAWLRAHCLSPEGRAARRRRPALWDAGLQQRLPKARHEAVAAAGSEMAAWLARVRDFGFARLEGVPCRSGEVCRVAELFGHVRETNYGRFFDVVAEQSPSNLAYTGLALGLHTDNPYREPVPSLQLLHCLEASAEGGESLVADGFFAAERLRRESPEDFALLTRHAVDFYYRDSTAELSARAPLIELDAEGGVRAVRYNNRSVAPLDLPPEVLPGFYRAYRRFSLLLHDPAGLVSFRLAPGDLFILDNRRVLHGRGGFAGRRHLQGCYADVDGLLSKLAILERQK